MMANEATIVSAEAFPVLPPRPEAFATLLTSDDDLPGAQTVLFSIQKTLAKSQRYPSELILLATPNISEATRARLYPNFCTRIIDVDPINFAQDSVQFQHHGASSCDVGGGLTKLHLFGLQQYETIVYVDPDCLVVKDLSHLLDLGKLYQDSEALLAAAPDIFPPDKFNAGVLVIRPSTRAFESLMQQSKFLVSYDGGATGLLNAYYSEWHSSMPPFSRLSFGYNAQQGFMDGDHGKHGGYWDLAVKPDLHIVHFSRSPKPCESKPSSEDLSRTDLDKHAKRAARLQDLWWKWYERSQTFGEKQDAKREQAKRRAMEAAAEAAAAASRKPPPPPKRRPTDERHNLVTKRYKELRKQGLSAKEAMEKAQEGVAENAASPTDQVAAMFGLS